jgi:hypothetical protein
LFDDVYGTNDSESWHGRIQFNNITFTEDMIGHEFVAFQYLEQLVRGEYQMIASHEDINDKDQTVKVMNTEYNQVTFVKRILLSDYEQAVKHGDNTTFSFGVSITIGDTHHTSGVIWLGGTGTEVTFSGNPNSANKSYAFEYDKDGNFTGYILKGYIMNIPKFYTSENKIRCQAIETGDWSATQWMPSYLPSNTAWEGGYYNDNGEITFYKWVDLESNPTVVFTNTYKNRTTSITIDKQIQADSYTDPSSPLTFTFRLTGTTDSGTEIDRSLSIQMTPDYIKENTNEDGTVTKSLVFDELAPGTYTVAETYSNGYDLIDITDLKNGEAKLGMEGYTGVFTIDKNNTGYAVYVNEKSEVTWHGKMKENKFVVDATTDSTTPTTTT